MGDGPAAQEVTDDQLIEAVEVVCKERGIPVAPTKYVARVEGISIQQQQVKRRLERLTDDVSSLKIGRGKIWWVPDNPDNAGQHEMSSIQWDNIAPEEVPLELIERHPELHVPTYWEKWGEKSDTLFSAALALTIPGFVIFALKDATLPLVSIGGTLATLGAIAAVAGIFIGAIALILLLTSRLGISMSSRGIDEVVIDFRNRLFRSASRRIPVSISITWKSDQD